MLPFRNIIDSMDTRKKIIITFLLILLLLAPVFFFFLSRESSPIDVPKRKRPVSIPLIPEEVKEQDYKISFNVKKETFDFPEHINLITYEPSTLEESELNEIAEKLVFEDEPKVTDDYFDGKIITYTNSSAYLTSSLDIGEITFGLHQIPAFNTEIEESEIIDNAISFLNFSSLTNTNENLVSDVIYLKRAIIENELEPTSNINVEVYQINFSPNISEYPILTINPEKTLTFVRIMSDGQILSAHTTRLQSIETSDERRLKNYQEVKDTLEEAIIVSINQGLMFNDVLPQNVIRKIDIESISLAYLQLSQESTTIQPVYLLEGIANINSINEDLPITLYLPAISQN